MPADIADWTQAVVVSSGTVTISGTATVAISGTPTVNINAGQTIGITGTVTVSVSGTPTVNIAAAQTIGISGTPTVNINSGQSIGITGTVTVSVSGTPTVAIAAAQTIGISGTPTVAIAAAQTIGISGTPTVSISGTPSITVSSGTINVQTAGGINLTTVTPSVTIASLTTGTGVWTSASQTVPSGAIAIMVQWSASALFSGTVAAFKLTGDQTGTDYFNEQSSVWSNLDFDGFICYVSPYDTTFKVTTNFSGATTVKISAFMVPVNRTSIAVAGIIGGQPVNVQKSSKNLGLNHLNNSIASSGTLNVTASDENLLNLYFSLDGGAAAQNLSFIEFGAGLVWYQIQTNGAGAVPIVVPDLNRWLSTSGFKIVNGTANAVNIRGTVFYDNDQ